jgi:hypothetical protein
LPRSESESKSWSIFFVSGSPVSRGGLSPPSVEDDGETGVVIEIFGVWLDWLVVVLPCWLVDVWSRNVEEELLCDSVEVVSAGTARLEVRHNCGNVCVM